MNAKQRERCPMEEFIEDPKTLANEAQEVFLHDPETAAHFNRAITPVISYVKRRAEYLRRFNEAKEQLINDLETTRKPSSAIKAFCEALGMTEYEPYKSKRAVQEYADQAEIKLKFGNLEYAFVITPYYMTIYVKDNGGEWLIKNHFYKDIEKTT